MSKYYKEPNTPIITGLCGIKVVIIINPDNKRQSNHVKTMLKEMRISFTSHTDETVVEVSAAELESIDKGLEDVSVKNDLIKFHYPYHDDKNLGDKTAKESIYFVLL